MNTNELLLKEAKAVFTNDVIDELIEKLESAIQREFTQIELNILRYSFQHGFARGIAHGRETMLDILGHTDLTEEDFVLNDNNNDNDDENDDVFFGTYRGVSIYSEYEPDEINYTAFRNHLTDSLATMEETRQKVRHFRFEKNTFRIGYKENEIRVTLQSKGNKTCG